jgi:4a-hydroxytetrahydrobiopterin dehydratase
LQINGFDISSFDRPNTRQVTRLPSSLNYNKLNELNASVLSRSFTTKDFQAALDCINRIGAVAEEMGHHPDIHLTNYRNVEIVLHTHKLKGVTENDIALATALDEKVKIDYSPKWLREHSEAASTAQSMM